MIAENKDMMRQLFKRIFIVQLVMISLLLLLSLIGYIRSNVYMGTIYFSFVVGCIGSGISLQQNIQKEKIDTVKLLSESWINTLMPFLYGGLLAVVTYILFMSGILSGDGGEGLFTSNLFPNFTRPELSENVKLNFRIVLEIRPVDVKDFGKLLVWCFISGYSERFVTSILKVMEQKEASK